MKTYSPKVKVFMIYNVLSTRTLIFEDNPQLTSRDPSLREKRSLGVFLLKTFMNNSKSILLVVAFCGLLASVPAQAQLSVSASGAYGISAQSGNAGMLGAGIGVKYYFSAKLAAGIRARGYLESLSRNENGLDSKLTALTIPIMATVEYHLTDTDLNPYVGLEAGIQRQAVHTRVDFKGRTAYDDTTVDNNFALAPKVGLSYDVTQGISVMVEALYNVGFSKNQAGETRFNFDRSAKFLAFHAGVSFTFGNRFD